MNDTAPDVSLAVLFTRAPFGASLLMSIPTPPPYENVLANLPAVSYIDSILSSGAGRT